MLTLTRRRGEAVVIRVGDKKIIVTIADIASGKKVALGFVTDRDVEINRFEIDRAKYQTVGGYK